MVIDIQEFRVRIVGQETLNKIEEQLKEYKEQGKTGIVVDFKDRGVNQEDTINLARLKYKYGCIYKGIGSKKFDIDKYLKTGYFVKEDMGEDEYAKWLREKIEDAGYPLMIKDNRLQGDALERLNIIQPVSFDERYFHYKILRPKYLEPMELERAVKLGKLIYREELMGIREIGLKEEGIRFAGNRKERYIMDIFNQIINRQVVGFSE